MASSVRVIIADDHPIMRSGIRATLAGHAGIEVVAEAATGDEMQELCASLLPDVVLMDISMPGPPFIKRVEFIKALPNPIAILVLSAFDDAIYVQAMFKAGVEGYVLKDEVSETLVTALRAVASGGTYYSRRIFAKLNEFDLLSDALGELTPREHEVLELVALGRNNAAIASELDLAEQTVRNYVSNLYEKTGCSSRVELAVWARKHGLVDDTAP